VYNKYRTISPYVVFMFIFAGESFGLSTYNKKKNCQCALLLGLAEKPTKVLGNVENSGHLI
jgi:hypothetical protein